MSDDQDMVTVSHLVLAVPQEVAGGDVPEDGECCEGAVLSVSTVLLALLSGTEPEIQFQETLNLVVMFERTVMTDIPDGLHKYVGT